MRNPLLLTLLWTILLCAIIGAVAMRMIATVTAALGDYAPLAMALGAVAIAIALWFTFGLIENAILFCYANRIVAAVETRHYPMLPTARGASWPDAFWSGARLLIITILSNILALPIYLIVPGANLVLFLGLNGYLLGRAYFDAVALRRLDDRSASLVWRAGRGGFVLNGVISTALLAVPVVNLAVPIIGLAAAVHLFEGRTGAHRPRI